MKHSINKTIKAIDSYIDEISEVLGELANGELRIGIDREYFGQFGIIKEAFSKIVDSLNRTLSEINQASYQVMDGAKQISNTSLCLAQGAAQQTEAIEQLTLSINNIDQQVKATSDSAAQASAISEGASAHALSGNDEMANMTRSMEDIKDSSSNISKIIKVIQDIAMQTNLLALNASVESARAGIHGKGFAVVAQEVRNLASKSQDAANDSASLVESSIQKVSDGANNAGSVAQALARIVKDTREVSDLVTGIAFSASEQAKAISALSESLKSISDVVKNNNATSQESAAASQELSSQAETLQGLVSYFRLKEENKSVKIS